MRKVCQVYPNNLDNSRVLICQKAFTNNVTDKFVLRCNPKFLKTLSYQLGDKNLIGKIEVDCDMLSKHECDSVGHDVSFRSLGGFATWCWHCNMNSGDTAGQVNSGDTAAIKSQVSLVRKKSPLTHLVDHDDHDMRWSDVLTIGLWIHIRLLQSKGSFPSPFLIAPIPNAIRRPLQSPLFQALLVAVASRGKGGGQLHSSSWSVGVVLISWLAGPGCRLHWHLHILLFWFSFSSFLSFFAAGCKCMKCKLLVVDTPSHPS